MTHARGILLEGLSNAGKTSTLNAIKKIQAADEDSERSVFILGEHYSQQLQNIQGEIVSLSRDEHLNLLNDRAEGIEKLNDWATHLGPASRRSRGLFFVLERFHLNHRFAYGVSPEIEGIEKRLSAIGGCCFLLTISEKSIRERLLYRNEIHLNEIEQACDEWLADQERLMNVSRQSNIPTTVINTDNQEWELYASQIIQKLDIKPLFQE